MATEINAGRVAMVPKGEWSASTAYTRLDVVQYNGSSYVCKQDGTGQNPSTATTYWQLLASGVNPSNYYTKTETNIKLGGKQDALVSGQNIKSINGQSVLGAGNMTIHEEQLIEKSYAPAEFSGLGRKYLQKNIVSDKNVLTQVMMQDANTIYVIQYDYDLNGQSITVPSGCVLQFEGGSLSNGTLVGDDTAINNTLCKIFSDDITFNGSFSNNWYPEWFGAIADGVTDCTTAFQLTNRVVIYDLFTTNSGKSYAILLSEGVYSVQGNRIFGSIYDRDYEPSPRTYAPLIVKGVSRGTTKINWKPTVENDVLFNLNNEIINANLSNFSIRITTGSNEHRGIVFDLNNTKSPYVSNNGNNYINLSVSALGYNDNGAWKYEVCKTVFNVTGWCHCDLANFVKCNFSNFEKCVVISNREAVGWVFFNCSFYPGPDNKSSEVFVFNEMYSNFTLNSCNGSFINGNKIIRTIANSNALTGVSSDSQIVIENCRFEAYDAANETNLPVSFDLEWGYLIINNSNLSTGVLRSIVFDVKGCGKVYVGNSVLPEISVYIPVRKQTFANKFDFVNTMVFQNSRYVNVTKVGFNDIDPDTNNWEHYDYYEKALDNLTGSLKFIECYSTGNPYSFRNYIIKGFSGSDLINACSTDVYEISLEKPYQTSLELEIPPYQIIVGVSVIIPYANYTNLGQNIVLEFGGTKPTSSSLDDERNVLYTITKPFNNYTTEKGFGCIELFNGIAFIKDVSNSSRKIRVYTRYSSSLTATNMLVNVKYQLAPLYLLRSNSVIKDSFFINTKKDETIYNGSSIIRNNMSTYGYAKLGTIFYDTDLNKHLHYDGTKWSDEKGYTAASNHGTTANRPTPTSTDAGFTYWDTTLGKMIAWNGSAWVNLDGTALV